ncbi:hypothetical protein [Candidatus Vidania fulgoroideorum]
MISIHKNKTLSKKRTIKGNNKSKSGRKTKRKFKVNSKKIKRRNMVNKNRGTLYYY